MPFWLKRSKINKQHSIKFFDQEMEKRANDFFSMDNLLEKAVKKVFLSFIISLILIQKTFPSQVLKHWQG